VEERGIGSKMYWSGNSQTVPARPSCEDDSGCMVGIVENRKWSE
jgi:hypothetical protein